MQFEKCFRKITRTDLRNTGVYNDIDFKKHKKDIKESKPGAVGRFKETLDRGNQLLKKDFFTEQINEARENYKGIDKETGLTISGFFIDSIGDLKLIGIREINTGNKDAINVDKCWYFEGCLTLAEYEYFGNLYKQFIDNYSSYKKVYYDLTVNIIGGIYDGRIAISPKNLIYWQKENILIRPWGFDINGNMACFDKSMVHKFLLYKEKAKKIREKGGIDDIQDLKTLQKDDLGWQLFDSIFNKNEVDKNE